MDLCYKYYIVIVNALINYYCFIAAQYYQQSPYINSNLYNPRYYQNQGYPAQRYYMYTQPKTQVQTTTNSSIARITAPNKTSIENHPSWKYLDSTDADCGESFADRIIGGVEANLGQYPWIARLGYTYEDEPDIEFKCGGVLISPKNVLTAAHCVKNLEEGSHLSTIRLGEHDVDTESDCNSAGCAAPVQDFTLKVVLPHPDYNRPPFSHDIAIITLDRPADYNGWVGPICLPRGKVRSLKLQGQRADVAGWGIMDMSSERTASRLQTVSLPIVAPSECGRIYRSKVTMSADQMCAGAEVDKDACGGDSGGPMMKVFSEDGEAPRYYLIAVVSFGPTRCGVNIPGVYANVSYHLPWILDNITR